MFNTGVRFKRGKSEGLGIGIGKAESTGGVQSSEWSDWVGTTGWIPKVASTIMNIGFGGLTAGIGALAAEAVGSQKKGIFSTIGGWFKKKEGGTVLGNVLRDTVGQGVSGLVSGIGTALGSKAGEIGSSIFSGGSSGAMQDAGLAADLKGGMKEGFMSAMWEKYKGVITIIGTAVVGLIIWLFVKLAGKRKFNRYKRRY